MEHLAATVSTWWPQICSAITTGVTNAASENANRLIKTDARCATTRQARGHLTRHTSGRHDQPRHSSP